MVQIFKNIGIGDLLMVIRRCSSLLRCCRCSMSDVYIGRTLAQTPLDRFVSICYTSKFATNMVKSRTDGAYSLVYRTYMVDRRRRVKHGGPSSILLIPANSVRRRNFFLSPQLRKQKWVT